MLGWNRSWKWWLGHEFAAGTASASTDLRELDPAELHAAISAVFQDHATYQASAAENIALGDVRYLGDRARIEAAAERGGPGRWSKGCPTASTWPAPGTKVRAFTAVTTDGEHLGRDRLSGRVLAGFFAQGCPMCEESVGTFVRLAQEHEGGRDRVLAVVVGRPETAASYVDRLDGAARVLTEPFDGPVSAAFENDGFPAFLRLEGPVVLAATGKIAAFAAQHAGRG